MAKGYSENVLTDLESMLTDQLQDFQEYHLQPNAGAQGEYAGLMVIRKFHLNRWRQKIEIFV